MKEEGSGFAADPVEPLLSSSDPNFRPVDIEFGPDGALYVLDWFNPLVGHMQHSIRDPNRDQAHGRIWRITYKKRPLREAGADRRAADRGTARPAEGLRRSHPLPRAPRAAERPRAKSIAAVDKWVAALDAKRSGSRRTTSSKPCGCSRRHDVVDEALLTALLGVAGAATCGGGRAGAVLRARPCRRPLALLQQAVNDEHPRVRLEAIRALSFFGGEQASPPATSPSSR